MTASQCFAAATVAFIAGFTASTLVQWRSGWNYFSRRVVATSIIVSTAGAAAAMTLLTAGVWILAGGTEMGPFWTLAVVPVALVVAGTVAGQLLVYELMRSRLATFVQEGHDDRLPSGVSRETVSGWAEARGRTIGADPKPEEATSPT